jgi:hypothetical protein
LANFTEKDHRLGHYSEGRHLSRQGHLSEDEASYLNYRLMIVYHCRVSKESSDSPFSQTKGLREESHFGCVNSICRMNQWYYQNRIRNTLPVSTSSSTCCLI